MEAVKIPNIQYVQTIKANTVQEAVHEIAGYIEDTGKRNHDIYFHGWSGLGASAVLKSVAKEPPPSLRSKIDSIIHIDCSKWKNRREIQRKIAQELQLPKHVMDMFSRQDEEDDFAGVDESSRTEIRSIGEIIYNVLRGLRWLVVLHNGSSHMVDLTDFGIPQPDQWSNGMVLLWTYSGRLRGISGLYEEYVGSRYMNWSLSPEKWKYDPKFIGQPHTGQELISHSYLRLEPKSDYRIWTMVLQEEATEIAQYTNNVSMTPDIAAEFCRYLLSLNRIGEDGLDFNWPSHASNYWVCDGITQEFQQDKAWEVAAALHEQMRLESLSSFRLPDVGGTERWVVATSCDVNIQQETTSFFLLDKDRYIMRKKLEEEEHKIDPFERDLTTGDIVLCVTLSSVKEKMFKTAEHLHVLKLCHCLFSFSSPPFLQCRNIRFLGLDRCKDSEKENICNKLKEEEEEKDIRKVIEFLQSLFVLDISHTDWELNLSPDIVERMAMNMREISIKQGRIWHDTHAWSWRHLQDVHKLRVIEPTCPWETGSKDQFTGMVKLELLDLSGNSTMQVLPSLSSTTSLTNLVLDGCNGLKHVLPGTLPPSLETFSFDAGSEKGHNKEATKVSRISLSGCTRLVNIRLRGFLGNLEELDLSNTSIKSLDLIRVQVPSLQHVIMMGCERLCAIVWPWWERGSRSSYRF